MKKVSYLLSSITIIALITISCEKALIDEISTDEDLTIPVETKRAEKITICHLSNNTWSTINVSAKAVAAHIAHGDYYGACSGDECSLDFDQGF